MGKPLWVYVRLQTWDSFFLNLQEDVQAICHSELLMSKTRRLLFRHPLSVRFAGFLSWIPWQGAYLASVGLLNCGSFLEQRPMSKENKVKLFQAFTQISHFQSWSSLLMNTQSLFMLQLQHRYLIARKRRCSPNTEWPLAHATGTCARLNTGLRTFNSSSHHLCLTNVTRNLSNIQPSTYQEYTAMAQVGHRRNARRTRNSSFLSGEYDLLPFKLNKMQGKN